MPLKRTEQDWHFDYLTIEEESKELDQIMEHAIEHVEELIDVLYADDLTKNVVEIAWASNFLREKRKYAKGIDIYKQQIHRIFMNYEK